MIGTTHRVNHHSGVYEVWGTYDGADMNIESANAYSRFFAGFVNSQESNEEISNWDFVVLGNLYNWEEGLPSIAEGR
jgi:hypothetical protein